MKIILSWPWHASDNWQLHRDCSDAWFVIIMKWPAVLCTMYCVLWYTGDTRLLWMIQSVTVISPPGKLDTWGPEWLHRIKCEKKRFFLTFLQFWLRLGAHKVTLCLSSHLLKYSVTQFWRRTSDLILSEWVLRHARIIKKQGINKNWPSSLESWHWSVRER